MKKVKSISVALMLMLFVVGCSPANTPDMISDNVNDVVLQNDTVNSSCYPISFIGDAFRYDRGLASVVLQNGDVCVIDENGTPIVVMSGTKYSGYEENELGIPDFLPNGCFVFTISNGNDTRSEYVFSHNGTLLKHLVVGASAGCDALITKHGSDLDAFYWLSTEGSYNTVSYTLTKMDADGNINSQTVPEEIAQAVIGGGIFAQEGMEKYITRVEYEKSALELMGEKIAEKNQDLTNNRVFCHLMDDGSAVILVDGVDGKPYYAHVSEEGVRTSEMIPLDAEGAVFCGQNILMIHTDPESDGYSTFSMLDVQTDTISDLDFLGAIDGTDSRYNMRPFAEAGAVLENGRQIRRTNFIRPDGTMLFGKDSSGNTIIEIPDSVPCY